MLEFCTADGNRPRRVLLHIKYIIQHVAARFLPLQYSKALTPVV